MSLRYVSASGHIPLYWETRNTLTQASNNGRKPNLSLQKKIVSMFYAINILNTISYFKLTNFNCA